MTKANSVKWIPIVISACVATCGALWVLMGMHYPTVERIGRNADRIEVVSSDVDRLEAVTQRRDDRLVEWMKTLSGDQRKMGNAIVAITTHMNIKVPD